MGATEARETERKYEAPAGGELPDPASVFDLAVVDRAEVELDATYYDTLDLRLARAGITLRRRAGGDDAGWHLKLPIDDDSRREIRKPPGRGTRVPTELTALTRVHTRGERVVPVAKLVTRRHRWLLTDSGDEIAELAEDHVRGESLNPASGPVEWREFEIELTEDAPSGILDSLDERFIAAGARRSSAPAKLSRVLGDRIPRPTPVDGSTVVLGYLSEQVGILRAHDPLVRLDADDAVHRMRVTARRIRSALQGFRSVLDREATADIVEDLRWLGGELGPARDAEVTAARFADAVHALPDTEVLGPVSQQITRRFEREQALGRARAVAALDERRYLDLQDRLDGLLADPPLGVRKRKALDRALKKGVRKAHQRTAKRLTAADTARHRDEALHEARKAAKRLRYVLEVVEPVWGKKTTRLRKRVKVVASLLGDHHDTVTARPVLRELAAQTHTDGGNGFTFGVLHAREQAEAERLDARLPKAWKKVQKAR